MSINIHSSNTDPPVTKVSSLLSPQLSYFTSFTPTIQTKTFSPFGLVWLVLGVLKFTKFLLVCWKVKMYSILRVRNKNYELFSAAYDIRKLYELVKFLKFVIRYLNLILFILIFATSHWLRFCSCSSILMLICNLKLR